MRAVLVAAVMVGLVGCAGQPEIPPNVGPQEGRAEFIENLKGSRRQACVNSVIDIEHGGFAARVARCDCEAEVIADMTTKDERGLFYRPRAERANMTPAHADTLAPQFTRVAERIAPDRKRRCGF